MTSSEIYEPLMVLVEDDGDTEKLVLRELRRSGIKDVVVLRDGQEAADWFVKCEVQPWLVLLDAKLPYVDGMTILKNIRTYPAMKGTAVVMFSTDGSSESISQARKLGADDFAVKPVDSTELASIIRTLVSRYRPQVLSI